MSSTIRSYSELSYIPTFLGRFEYLKIGGYVGEATFGSKRYLNQALYQSAEWRRIRDKVIVRDWVMDPENLICVSRRTHEAIHYGDAKLLLENRLVERKPGDTILW